METSHIAEFTSDSGEKILVEVKEAIGRTTSVGRVQNTEKILSTSTKTFEAILESIHPISNAIFEKVKNLSSKPSEVAVEFGIKITVSGNLVVSSASGEGNFKVSLKWEEKHSQ